MGSCLLLEWILPPLADSLGPLGQSCYPVPAMLSCPVSLLILHGTRCSLYMLAVQAVAGHLTQRIGQYSSQSLSNVLWAFATQETNPGTPALDAAALLVCKTLQVSARQDCG